MYSDKDTSRLGFGFYMQIIATVLLVLLIVQLARKYMDYKFAAKKRQVTETSYNEIKTERGTILEKIKSINTKDGTEIYLRDQFRAIKPGEQLIIYSEEGSPDTNTTIGTVPPDPQNKKYDILRRFRN